MDQRPSNSAGTPPREVIGISSIAPLGPTPWSDQPSATQITHSVQQHVIGMMQDPGDTRFQMLMFQNSNALEVLGKMVASGFSLITKNGDPIFPKGWDTDKIPVFNIAWKRYIVCTVYGKTDTSVELIGEDGSPFSIENKTFVPINRLQEPVSIFGKEYIRLNWVGENWVRFIDVENGEPLIFEGKPVQMFRGEVEYEGVTYGSFYFGDVRFIDYTSPEWRMLDTKWNPLPLFDWRWILDKIVIAKDGTEFVNINVPNDSSFPEFRASRTGYVLRNGYRLSDKLGNPVGYIETEVLPKTLADSYNITVSATHRICICDADGLNTGKYGYIDSHGNYDRMPDGNMIHEYRTGYYGLEWRIWDYWYPLAPEGRIRPPFNLLYKFRNWRNRKSSESK